jgi:hypothetical protein
MTALTCGGNYSFGTQPFASAHDAHLGAVPIHYPPSPFPSVPLQSVTIFMSHDSPDVWWQLLLWHAAPSLPPTMPTSVWAPSAPHLLPSLPLPSSLYGLILAAIFVSRSSADVWRHSLLWHAASSLLPMMPTSVWAPSAPYLPASLMFPSGLYGLILIIIFMSHDSHDM